MVKKPYGKLTLITGPMFSSKTTELLRRVLWLQHGHQVPVLVLKPAFDNRYSEDRIVNHDGLSCASVSISNWESIEKIANQADTIFIDELQFFEFPYFESSAGIKYIIRSLLYKGINVVANGLDMDWQGNPFTVTANIAAMADEIIKRTAHCSVCGRPASKTFKIVADEQTVALGEADIYEPRCNEHWAAPEPKLEKS